MTNDVLTKTVGELVVERPSRSRVFERFSIDYCCGGRKTLADACADAGVATETVADALDAADRSGDADAGRNWSGATLSELIDHIVSTHHTYLRRELPRLSDMAAKVVNAHSDRHEWVKECREVFGGLRGELESHMLKEEQVLFPMIRRLEAEGVSPSGSCGGLDGPIGVMEHEHDNAGNALARLRTLSNGFTPPDDACNTFRAWLDGLSDLEADLHEHIHKENNILFPRAQELESSTTRA